MSVKCLLCNALGLLKCMCTRQWPYLQEAGSLRETGKCTKTVIAEMSSMMVNFVCQLHWATETRCVRVLLDESDIYIHGLWVKQIVLFNVVGTHPIGEGLNRSKGWPPLRKSEFCSRQSLTTVLLWASGPLAHPAHFRLASFHKHVSQFLKITLSVDR